MAANSVSSEPGANSVASRGFEPFFPLAASAVRRRCLVAVGNWWLSSVSIRCSRFHPSLHYGYEVRHEMDPDPVVWRKSVLVSCDASGRGKHLRAMTNQPLRVGVSGV